jgi:hypothetical protein
MIPRPGGDIPDTAKPQKGKVYIELGGVFEIDLGRYRHDRAVWFRVE